MNSHLKTTLFLDVVLCGRVICTVFSKWLPDNMLSHSRRHLCSHQCTLATFTPWKHLGESKDTTIIFSSLVCSSPLCCYTIFYCILYYNYLESFWSFILCRYCKNKLHYLVECVCAMSSAWLGEGEKVPYIFHCYWWPRAQLTVLAHYSALCKVQDTVDCER
jgi:hypothetical protein